MEERVQQGAEKAKMEIASKDVIKVGGKEIAVGNSPFTLRVNGSEMMSLYMRFTCASDAGDWGGVHWFENTVDNEAKTIDRVHKPYHGKDTPEVRLNSKVEILDDRRVKVTFIPDFNGHPRTGITTQFSFPGGVFHGHLMRIDDAKPWRVPMTGDTWVKTPFPDDFHCARTANSIWRKIELLKEDGTTRLSIERGENVGLIVFHNGSDKVTNIGVTIPKPTEPFSFIFDVGETYEFMEKHRIVGGVDFLNENDFRVGCWDEKVNYFLNPSFEGGLRYWRVPVENHPSEFLTDEDARTGRFSFRRPARYQKVFPPIDAKSVGIVLKPETDYTFSCYVKSAVGADLTKNENGRYQNFGSIQARGVHGYANMLKSQPLKPVGEKPDADEKGWMRIYATFNTGINSKDQKAAPVHEATFWWGLVDNLLYDDIQLVEGTNVVDFAMPPFSFAIDSHADNQAGFVDASRKNGKIDLIVRGAPSAEGELAIMATDLLGRDIFNGMRNFKFRLDGNGEASIALGEDSDFPKGVIGFRVKAHSKDCEPYEDYLRLYRFTFSDNTKKHRNFQTDPDGRKYVGVAKQKDIDEFLYWRTMVLGMGAISYTVPWFGQSHFDQGDWNLLKKYNLDEQWGAIRENIGWKSTINMKPWLWDGTNINAFVTFPDELLKWVEEQSYQSATSRPFQTFYSIDSEPAGKWAAIKRGHPEEYAKMLTAINHGLKRANPEIEFCPYGTWNMGHGTAEIANMLTLLKRVDPESKYTKIEVHSYREFPEDPDVETDLKTFFQRLENAGYPDILIRVGEGSYYFPMFRPTLGMYPWSGVGSHDGYSGIVIPSYDLGFGEKIGAALTLRETAMYYKYDDRIFGNCSWNPRYIDQYSPCGWVVANTALLEMLGNASFKDDIRFSPMSRCYVFDDGEGHATAIMWRGETAFDRGKAQAVTAQIPFGDLDVEFFDMYGNQVSGIVNREPGGEGKGEATQLSDPNSQHATTSDVGHGTSNIPLSGYPVYMRVPMTKYDRFVEALKETYVPEDATRLPLTTALKLKDANTAELKVINPLSRTLSASLKIDGLTNSVEILLKGGAEMSVPIPLDKTITSAGFAEVKKTAVFTYEGTCFHDLFETSALAVEYVNGDVDWSKLPDVEIGNFSKWQPKGPHTDRDFGAKLKLGWNEHGLYMGLDVKDNIFIGESSQDPKTWGMSDMVWFCFDSYANGRERAKRKDYGMDFDDFSNGLFVPPDGKGYCLRRRAPDHQLTGGAGYGFVAGTVEDHYKVDFSRSDAGYRWRVEMPAYYLMPLRLESGAVSPGFGISVYDKDYGGPNDPPVKSVSRGSGDEQPHTWPQLIFLPGNR